MTAEPRIDFAHDLSLYYHEWVFVGRRELDRRGRSNPRMATDNASLWRCNNGDCPARAAIGDEAIGAIFDAAIAAGGSL